MPRGRGLFLGAALLAGACAQGALRSGYPPYYREWEGIPAALASELERARSALEEGRRDAQEKTLLRYARLTARLARIEGRSWLAAASREGAGQERALLLEGRARLLESCRQSLSLYQQILFAGGELAWQDRVEMAYLELLQGEEARAGGILEKLAADPTLPAAAARRIGELLGALAPPVAPAAPAAPDPRRGKRSTG